MADYASQEKKIRIQAAIIRAVTDLIFALAAVFAFLRKNSLLTDGTGYETYRSVGIIILVSVIADILICIGDYLSPKIYTAHFLLNFIVTIITVLILAAISGPMYTFLIPAAMILPFLYHSLRSRKITDIAMKQMNEAFTQYQKKEKK